MSTLPPQEQVWRDWAPDLVLGSFVFALGILETLYQRGDGTSRLSELYVALGMAVAAGLSRRAPAAALTLVWVVCGLQVVSSTPLMFVQLAVAVVAFGCARWGRLPTVLLAGLSIPVAACIPLLLRYRLFDLTSNILDYRAFYDTIGGLGPTYVVGAVIAGAALLFAPWFVGLAFRYRDRAQVSRLSQVAAEADAAAAVRATEQVREIARLRDEQARLARDVHDVVGHSLAVILAQAESAQYLPDDDPDALKRTMANIATSARSSLQDVRQVLATEKAPPQAKPGGLDTLVAGVRASGHEVLSSEVGTPQPLPPELDVVAFRVLQEMLTNAIKHGRRDQPVVVERHWPDGFGTDLRIEVSNASAPPPDADLTQPISPTELGGQGLAGMQRRLESVGGRIDVRRRDEPDGPTFTATAWVPVRTG